MASPQIASILSRGTPASNPFSHSSCNSGVRMRLFRSPSDMHLTIGDGCDNMT